MTTELFQAPVMAGKSSYPKSVTDIHRMALYIDDDLIDTDEEEIKREGLFSIYKNKIKNQNLALFFALNNHQDSLYQDLLEIGIKIQSAVVNDKSIDEEERQKRLLAISQSWNMEEKEKKLVMHITRLSENKYQYTAVMKNPLDSKKDFYSVSFNVEQNGKNIIYSKPEIKLSEEAKNYLGTDKILYTYKNEKTSELINLTELNFESKEKRKFLGKDDYKNYFEMRSLQTSKQIEQKPPELSMNFLAKFIDTLVSFLSKLGNTLSFGLMGRGYSPTMFKPAPVFREIKKDDSIQNRIPCSYKGIA